MFKPGFKDSSPLSNAQHMQLRPIFRTRSGLGSDCTMYQQLHVSG